MQNPVSITAISSVSPLGNNDARIWENYLSDSHLFGELSFGNEKTLGASLDETARKAVSELRESDSKYKQLDDSVLFAILASRDAVKNAGWDADSNFGINIGSSRGATGLFEKHHADFLKSGRANTLSSPTTTLGNISSWVAHDLGTSGPEISHSITCSTALHALLNGVAWIRSGMAEKFLVGGSEAPLTPFTIAQMRAMKIYSKETGNYPCRALDLDKKQNTMILGEGAAVCCLESGIAANALAVIEGVGYATELLEHSTSISAEADCFQRSMKMALKGADPADVDVIVMHAPGTIAGDRSELAAIRNVFGEKIPLLTTNKWKTGHTFGTSGMLNIELAVMMMQHQHFIGVPFADRRSRPALIKKALVNSVGFGGNAVSILLSER